MPTITASGGIDRQRRELTGLEQIQTPRRCDTRGEQKVFPESKSEKPADEKPGPNGEDRPHRDHHTQVGHHPGTGVVDQIRHITNITAYTGTTCRNGCLRTVFRFVSMKSTTFTPPEERSQDHPAERHKHPHREADHHELLRARGSEIQRHGRSATRPSTWQANRIPIARFLVTMLRDASTSRRVWLRGLIGVLKRVSRGQRLLVARIRERPVLGCRTCGEVGHGEVFVSRED